MMDPKYTHRVIEAHTLYSSHLNEDRTLKVYLPPEYNPDSSYPVLYCHDGLEFFTHGRIATIANQLVDEGKLRPLLIVAIAVQMKTRFDDYAMSGRRHAAYSRFVAEECVPFVETTYPVSREQKQRFMAGISLGAVASLSLALQYPDLFRRLMLFSGAYYPDVQQRIREVSSLSGLEAFMLVGRQETAVDTAAGQLDFYQYSHVMRDMLRVRGVKLDYDEADGTHIWGFWQKHMTPALTWLERVRSEDTGY